MTERRHDPAGTDDESRTAPSPSLQEALTTAISTGHGVSGIAAVLHDALGGTIVIDDGTHSRLAHAGDAVPDGQILPTARPLGSQQHAVAFRAGDWLLAEACPAGEVLGVIGLYDPEPGTAGSQESALQQGAMVLAAEMYRLHSVASNELRVWGDLAAELLDNPDIDRVRSHAAALGYPIDRPHRALVIELAGSGALPSMMTIRRVFRATRIDGRLATTRVGGIVLFVADDLDWHELARQLNGPNQPELRLGIGGHHDVDSLRESAAEAVLALRLSGAPVARYEELGILRFLASDADEVRLRAFVHDWLGDLDAYDCAHGTDLVHTLGEWLRDQQSLRATAERLHIHPSTLKYRLRRIGDVTGRDLHDPEHRFNLDLACRTRTTLVAVEASGFHRSLIQPTDTPNRPVGADRPPEPLGVSPLNVEVAVLDQDGMLTWVNDAWREFTSANGGTLSRCGIGTSYFDACAGAPDDPQSLLAVSAVRLAIAGQLPAPARLTMPCHGPEVSRWFEMSISSRQDDTGHSCGSTIAFTPTTHRDDRQER